MEEMLEVMKKQLKMQKLISGLLAVMLVILLIAGGFFVNRMSQMTAAMSEAADKLQQVDVDGINDAIGTTQEMLESAGELSDAVDSVTLKVKEFNDWMSGTFLKLAGVNKNKPARRDCGAGLPRSSRRLRWWKNRCPRWL